jgi:hypothetical protein
VPLTTTGHPVSSESSTREGEAVVG